MATMADDNMLHLVRLSVAHSLLGRMPDEFVPPGTSPAVLMVDWQPPESRL
jgi:hypothetical protein